MKKPIKYKTNNAVRAVIKTKSGLNSSNFLDRSIVSAWAVDENIDNVNNAGNKTLSELKLRLIEVILWKIL